MACVAKKGAPKPPARRTSFGGGTTERGLNPPKRTSSPLESRNPSPPQARPSPPAQTREMRTGVVAFVAQRGPSPGKAAAKAQPTTKAVLLRRLSRGELPKQEPSAPEPTISPPRACAPGPQRFELASPEDDASQGGVSDSEGLDIESSPSVSPPAKMHPRGSGVAPDATRCLGPHLALASSEDDNTEVGGDEVSSVEWPPTSSSSSPCRTSLGSTQASLEGEVLERRIEDAVRNKLKHELRSW